MIDHLEIKTRKLEENVRFYSNVLKPLGYTLKVDSFSKGFGDGQGLDLFFLEGDSSINVHFAFSASSRAIVNEVYELAKNAGHKLEQVPALALHIHANYYAGYLRDPDDRLIEFVCHLPVQ